ncbi:MAG: TonB-dependent receptor [Gemmatimonadetes bacterium]|nr:TonB-dependent receptor [Gemmatimonadota bacterium]NNM04501.1 TonB-dependent receptor [Gemmatimonadota bacterium]
MFQRVRLSSPPASALFRLLLSAALFVSLPSPLCAQVRANVDVRVSDGATGSPVVSATVVIMETGHMSTTDSRGLAEIRGVPPGRHALRVSAFGYRTELVEVEALNGRNSKVSLSLTPAPVEISGVRAEVAATGLPSGGIEVKTEDLDPTVTDLPDALDGVPGVTITRRGGPGAPAEIHIRGSNPEQVLVLLDGVPLNSPLTGRVDLSTVDLSSLARVVVLPGAQSSRYGPRALGGVVLLESRTADGDSGHLAVGGGAWGGREISGWGSWLPTPDWSVSAGGQWNSAKGDFRYDVPEFRGGGEGERENADFRRTGGQLQVSRSWENATTSLRAHVTEIERGSPGTIAQPSISGSQDHRMDGASLRIKADADRTGGSFLLSLQSQRAEYRDPAPPFGQAYDQTTRVSQRELAADMWRRAGQATVRAGVVSRRLHVRADALRLPASTMEERGAWSRLEFSAPVSPITRLDAKVGLRLDRHDLVKGTSVSPSASVSLNFPRTRMEVGFRQAFSPPNLGDLFFQEGVQVKANPDLRPERVPRELSLSLTHRLELSGATLEARASAYQGDIDDMILWSPDFQFVWSPGNHDVSRRGLEVGASLGIPRLDRTHTIVGHLAWSHVEYRGEVLSGQVAYRPRFSGELVGTMDMEFGAATLRLSHIGSRRALAGSSLNTLSPYSILDLGFEVPIHLGRSQARVETTLSNLLDERATLLVDYPLPGRGWAIRLHISTPNL